jgi:hypothetical protein
MNIFLNNSKELGLEIFKLVFGRALKAIYISLPIEEQKQMEKIFTDGSQKQQINFLNKYSEIFSDSINKELKEIEIKLENENTANT